MTGLVPYDLPPGVITVPAVAASRDVERGTPTSLEGAVARANVAVYAVDPRRYYHAFVWLLDDAGVDARVEFGVDRAAALLRVDCLGREHDGVIWRYRYRLHLPRGAAEGRSHLRPDEWLVVRFLGDPFDGRFNARVTP